MGGEDQERLQEWGGDRRQDAGLHPQQAAAEVGVSRSAQEEFTPGVVEELPGERDQFVVFNVQRQAEEGLGIEELAVVLQHLALEDGLEEPSAQVLEVGFAHAGGFQFLSNGDVGKILQALHIFSKLLRIQVHAGADAIQGHRLAANGQ